MGSAAQRSPVRSGRAAGVETVPGGSRFKGQTAESQAVSWQVGRLRSGPAGQLGRRQGIVVSLQLCYEWTRISPAPVSRWGAGAKASPQTSCPSPSWHQGLPGGWGGIYPTLTNAWQGTFGQYVPQLPNGSWDPEQIPPSALEAPRGPAPILLAPLPPWSLLAAHSSHTSLQTHLATGPLYLSHPPPRRSPHSGHPSSHPGVTAPTAAACPGQSPLLPTLLRGGSLC